MAVFDTCFSRSPRISSSFPFSLDLPDEPLGRPRVLPLAFAATSPSLVLCEIKSRSISANKANHRHHHLRLNVTLSSEFDTFLDCDKVHAIFHQNVDSLNDLAKASAQPRQLAHNQSVAWFETLQERRTPARETTFGYAGIHGSRSSCSRCFKNVCRRFLCNKRAQQRVTLADQLAGSGHIDGTSTSARKDLATCAADVIELMTRHDGSRCQPRLPSRAAD